MAMWVCASTRPGTPVRLDRSMMAAPAGMARPGPMALIFSPSTMMTWLGDAVPVSGSISRPALIAVIGGAGDWAGTAGWLGGDGPTNRQNNKKRFVMTGSSFLVGGIDFK